MTPKTLTIELDEETALSLEARASESGLSISELVAQMTILQARPVKVSREEIAELDRQWEAIKAGAPTVAHEDVEHWLNTWGTPAFKPWRDR